MADRKLQFNSLDQFNQQREMRRLELGEALAKDDYERVAQLDAKLIAAGDKNLTYEHARAEQAYTEFERREASRQPETPERAAEHDPQREPEIPVQQESPRTYEDLKREHADIVAHGQSQGQGAQEQGTTQEPEQKRLRFYEDLKHEHSEARDQGNEQAEGRGERDQEREGGDKKLAFFEDRNPSQGHDMEH